MLLKKIVKALTEKYLGDPGCVGITASTGLAAYNIAGTTLHRFAGIGIGKAPTEKLIKDILKSGFIRRRWEAVEVLVIDEISMINSTLFDKLDVIARAVRGVDLPFGGVQLVITGDFFQLPPVMQETGHDTPRFCFEASAWKQAIQHTISLTRIYRQRDPLFTKMLNEIREGRPSAHTIENFRKLSRPLESFADKGPEATELYPLRREADLANARRMQKIKGPIFTYAATSGGIIEDAATRQRLLNDCIAPEILELKQGAQVILTKNIDDILVNGSQGRVVGFANSETFFHSRWDDEDHELDPSTLLTGSMEDAPEQRPPLFPVVRFLLEDGSTRVELCGPKGWAVERWVPDPWEDSGWKVEKLATRTQVPLLPAWALSIHKAQGQTLDRVKVDLDRIFEMGQAYVALSRATTMDGLQVLNFNPDKIVVHPKVKRFYASLSKSRNSGE